MAQRFLLPYYFSEDRLERDPKMTRSIKDGRLRSGVERRKKALRGVPMHGDESQKIDRHYLR